MSNKKYKRVSNSSFKNISLGFVTHGPVSKHAFRLNENYVFLSNFLASSAGWTRHT